MQLHHLFLRHSKMIALIMALVILSTSVLGGTLAYIVTGTASLLNTFISGLDPTGDLTIRKTLTHPFGDGYVLPDGLEFTFLVDLGGDYAGKTLSTSRGDVRADENGTLTISVAPGAAVTIYDLNADTDVTITELLTTGFAVENGENPRTVTVPRRGAEVLFENTYTPEPLPYLNVRVSGTKLLTGRDWQEGDIFTFLLEQEEKTEDGSVWTQVGTATVEFALIEVEDPDNPGQTIRVPAPDFNIFDLTGILQSLDYEQAGTYCFRLSEEFGHVGGVTYDSVVSYFDVVVGDADLDGYLEVQSVLGYQNAAAGYDSDTDHFVIEVTVSNTYAPAGVAPASIQIRKVMESASGQEQSAAGFTFELYDENGGLVARTDPTSAAGEAFISLTYEAKEAGNTWFYTLKETCSGETHDGLIYDSTEYHIAVTVIDNLDGTVRAAVYLAEPGETALPEDAESTLTLTFTNRYDPADTAVTLSGTKELTGRGLGDGEFTFHLYQTGADFAVAEDAEPIRTVGNKADGSFAFAALPFDKVGVYHYVITEDASDPLGGVTYDDTRYLVTVTVTDVGGRLEAVTAIADHRGNETAICFRNSYRAAGTSAIFGGVKRLTGAELEAGMFSFELYEADADFNRKGLLVDKRSNSADGSFEFGQIEYSTAGEYYYLMLEDDSAQAAGITYDDTRYGVHVHVWDNGSGSLMAEVAIYELGGGRVSTAVFENVYTAPEPTDPTEPSEPAEPTEPTDPAEPTEPTDPTKPTEPADPSEPSEPAEPTDPSESTDPTDPTEPGGPETGDSGKLAFHTMALIACLTLMVVLLIMAEDYKPARTGKGE